MPLQNRVLPTGDIIATATRGTLTGNRGILHRADQTLGAARWTHHAWICCTLDWQGRKRQVMTGRNWTELFFLDEAVALAAGHRPCGYCRRAAYNRFVSAWEAATGRRPKAPDMDKALHRARIIKGTRRQQTYQAQLRQLPPRTFVAIDDTAHLWHGQSAYPYGPTGYGPPVIVDTSATITVLTPRPTVKTLEQGYNPTLHTTVDA